MPQTAVLEPFSSHIPSYPSDAPQWGDELLEAEVEGVANELRRHLVAALLASRQPPLDGPEAVKNAVLAGEILPLARKWRAYALDSRKRIDVRPWRGGVKTRVWTTKRVPTAEALNAHLPLSEGGCYLIVYGGSSSILNVKDENGRSVPNDVAELTSQLAVCDVIGWNQNDTSDIEFWSLKAGYSCVGTESSEIDFDVLRDSKVTQLQSPDTTAMSSSTASLVALGDIIPGWLPSDPSDGEHLMNADDLSDAAVWFKRHITIAVRSGIDVTITNPMEACEHLTERHLKPEPGKFTTWVLDSSRKREMYPSKWGMTAKRVVSNDPPTLDLLHKRAPLPYGGCYLVVWSGDSRNATFANSDVVSLLDSQEVADVCAWAGGNFTSLRAGMTLFKDGSIAGVKSGVKTNPKNSANRKEA